MSEEKPQHFYKESCRNLAKSLRPVAREKGTVVCQTALNDIY